jgi:hypothetical protein
MKILLDENLPHDLQHLLTGHDTFTVAYMGWSGRENGELLSLAADSGFEAILTVDTGVGYEHSPGTLPVSVIVLRSRTNKLDDIRPLVPRVLFALENLAPRAIVRIG